MSLRRFFGSETMELALLVIVLAVLFWQFQYLKNGPPGASYDSRYFVDGTLEPGPWTGPDNAHLATLCKRTSMPVRLKWRWAGACEGTNEADAGDLFALPIALQADFDALQRAIVAGEAGRNARLAPMAKSLAEGVLPESDQVLLAKISRELSDYRSHYQLAADEVGRATGSLTLDCAWHELSALEEKAAQLPSGPAKDQAGVQLLANRMAFVRGNSARLWWPKADGVSLADWAPGMASSCLALGLPQAVIVQAVGLVRQVRDGEKLARKAFAMQRMLARAPWLLASWALLTWLLLSLVRRTRHPTRYLPIALIAWAIAGAGSGLVMPTTGQPVPGWAWGTLAGAGFLLFVASRLQAIVRLTLMAPCPPQRNVTFLSFPMVVLFVGLGWWLVFDLAINGHIRNRYIALSQAISVFGAFVLLSVVPALSYGLAGLWMSWSGLITNALRPRVRGRLGGWLRPALLSVLYLLALAGLAWSTRNWRQFTGDAFRWWLLLGVAWFFMLRATRWTQPTGDGWRVHVSSAIPLFVHVAAVMLALVLTDDLGPLLVVLLAGAVYAGAFFAQVLLSRGMAWPLAAGVGVVASVAAAMLLVTSMFAFSKLPIGPAKRVAERVESVLSPFSAENDQLAHILWFRQHSPHNGYGLGSVPWCGTLSSDSCQGMPAQTQSDYTFTALQGVYGPWMTFGLLALYLRWLSMLAGRQAAQTQGNLATATPGGTEAAWLAWLAVCWAVLTVIQTLVTVMGNLGTLPLTGVTWPFLSFGTWSMAINAFFLGLVMHRLETAE